MPIVYEPAAPVAAYGRLGDLMGRNRLNQLAATGGGGGSRFQGDDDGPDFQAAVNFRDQMEFRRNQAAAEGVVTPAMAFQAEAEMNRQRQGYQLQAELQSLQLSQQEAVRLSRMKNAIGEVSADPTLSPEEKADMIAQLRTGISPLEQRAAKSKLAAEEQERQARAALYQEQAALRHQEALVTAKTAKDRTSFIPDPQALAEIAEDFRANLPGPYNEQAIQQMAEAEALRQGLGAHVFQEGYGKFQILKDMGGGAGAEAASTRGRGGAAGSDHPSGLTAEQYLRHRQAVVDRVDAWSKEMIPGDDGVGKKPRYANLADTAEFNNVVRGFLRSEGLPYDLTEFNAQRQPAQRRGYKSPFVPKAEGARAPEPSGNWIARRFEEAKAQKAVPFVTAQFDDQAAAVQEDAGLSADEKTAAAFLLNEGKRLVEEHPDPGTRPPEVTKRLQMLRENYLKLKGKMKGSGEGNVPPPERDDYQARPGVPDFSK